MLQNAWTESGNIPPWNLYDQVYQFAAAPNADGSINLLWLTQPAIQAFVLSRPAGKKALVTIKDNDHDSSAFAKATSSGTISTFVGNITKFINSNGYDGLTCDWEQNVVVSQYNDLLNRLRGNLGGKIIMTDMGDWAGLPSVAQTSQSKLDGVNIMNYDMSNGDNTQALFDAMAFTAGTGLRSIESRMGAFSNVSPSKLVVGIPFWGVKWVGTSQPFVHGNFPAPVDIDYRDLIHDPAWSPGNQQFRTDVGGSYLSVPLPPQFIPYCSPDQIKVIVAWAKGKGYAGIAPFVSNYDDDASTLGTALHAAITGSIIPIPPQPQPPAQFPCTVTTRIGADGVTATTTITRP